MSCLLLTGNTGKNYCGDGTILGDPVGIILATDAFSMTAAEFLSQSAWETAINARNVFPIMEIVNLTSAATEEEYIEHANKKRKFSNHGKYRFQIELDLNQEQKKNFLPFQGFTGKMFFVYAKDVIRGRSTNALETYEGVRVEMFNIAPEKLNSKGEAATIMVDIDLKSAKDLNLYDAAMEMDWDTEELDGLTEVDIEVTSASATDITFTIHSSVYGKTNPIAGLGFADIATYAGATSLTDNGNGSFNLLGTAMESGSLNLADPLATTDLFIVSSGAATVTI